MNTIEAFKKIINNPDFHARTGMSYTHISRYRRWAEGKNNLNSRKPSIEQMESLLLKYGCEVIQEKKWKVHCL